MRLGVFGGTFDPPHLGHLILATEAADQLQLDQVLWVLTPNSPLKQGVKISPVEIRQELLQAAIADLPGHIFSDVDIRRPGPQYAVETVEQLKADFPGAEVFYLVGGDSLRDFPRWRQPQRLLQEVSGLGVFRRAGARIDLVGLQQTFPELSAKLCWIHAPIVQISASDIRRRIQAGRTFRSLVPEKVFHLIESQRLYR